MQRSAIEWTEATWNPTTGCTKVSAGCKNCYAEAMARRLKAMGAKGYENGFGLSLVEDRLGHPSAVSKPTRFFVNSMSDLFHPEIPFAYIDRVMAVIANTPRHQYQILTKRHKIMAQYFLTREAPKNAWLGVTVENRRHGLPRVPVLRSIRAPVRFLSIEPLLEDLGLIDLDGIDWVIVGGESGPKSRPMKAEWVDRIHECCEAQGVPFFFKQWGSWGEDGVRRSKKANGRTYLGKTWDGFPEQKEAPWPPKEFTTGERTLRRRSASTAQTGTSL